jgi:hypothetical protein
VNFVIEKEFTDCSNLSVSVMEKEETKDAKAEEARRKRTTTRTTRRFCSVFLLVGCFVF